MWIEISGQKSNLMVILQKKKQLILIVDDAPRNIQVIGTILRKKGFLVSIAQSGSQALNIIDQSRPDLILLDIVMPGMDGFETCRRLKTNSVTTDIPVIFLSALSDTVDKVKGLNIGAVDYVTKPIEPEELLARINTHLTIQSLRRELKDINVTLEEKVLLRTQELARKNEALRESEERYRLLVETMNEGLSVLDSNGRLTYANPKYIAIHLMKCSVIMPPISLMKPTGPYLRSNYSDGEKENMGFTKLNGQKRTAAKSQPSCRRSPYLMILVTIRGALPLLPTSPSVSGPRRVSNGCATCSAALSTPCHRCWWGLILKVRSPNGTRKLRKLRV
jgi:DNA-binding response OmpR family regulator